MILVSKQTERGAKMKSKLAVGSVVSPACPIRWRWWTYLIRHLNFRRNQMTMLTMDARPAASFEYRTPVAKRSGLHRLFAAAIVNSQFREKLLTSLDLQPLGE